MATIDTDDIAVVVGIVADHPGNTAPELADHVAAAGLDPARTNKLLQVGVRRGFLIESQSTYWAILDAAGDPEGPDD